MNNDTKLLPCPFCGAGETVVEEKAYWTGMRSEITHVEVKHWCNKGTIDGAYLTIKGRTRDKAVTAWNTRPTPANVKPPTEALINAAATVSTMPEFSHIESPLILAICQAYERTRAKSQPEAVTPTFMSKSKVSISTGLKGCAVWPENVVADRHETTGKWVLWYLTDEQAGKCRAALQQATPAEAIDTNTAVCNHSQQQHIQTPLFKQPFQRYSLPPVFFALGGEIK